MMKSIPGFPHYLITKDGQIFSLHTSKLREMTVYREPTDGYWYVGLRENGTNRKMGIHALLLMTFIGPCPNRCQARHLDGNRSHNKLSNLKWGTAKENAKDRNKHERTIRGTKHYAARLSVKDVRTIRILSKRGVTRTRVAYLYQVAPTTVSKLVLGNSWRHVK
jgi:hypothetical protein